MTAETRIKRYPRPEIINTPERSIIVNRSTESGSHADVISSFKYGLPNSWCQYFPWADWIIEDRGGVSHLYVDNICNPRYVAKIKKYTSWYKNRHASNCNTQFSVAGEGKLAMASVINEVLIYPAVRDLLSRPKALKIARKHGFRRLTTPEPLVAVVEKSSREKILVYPFVKGITQLMYDDDRFERAFGYKQEKFVSQLRAHFTTNGINPEELDTHQLLLSGDENSGELDLYILDLEAFSAIRS